MDWTSPSCTSTPSVLATSGVVWLEGGCKDLLHLCSTYGCPYLPATDEGVLKCMGAEAVVHACLSRFTGAVRVPRVCRCPPLSAWSSPKRHCTPCWMGWVGFGTSWHLLLQNNDNLVMTYLLILYRPYVGWYVAVDCAHASALDSVFASIAAPHIQTLEEHLPGLHVKQPSSHIHYISASCVLPEIQ